MNGHERFSTAPRGGLIHRGAVWLVLGYLLGVLPSLAVAQGQLINGNRTLAGALNYCVAGGSSNNYTCPLNPAITAYQPGQCILFRSPFANTGPATLAVNALGAVAIRKAVPGSLPVNVAAGDIQQGHMVSVCVDEFGFQLMGTIATGGGGGGSGTVNPGVAGATPYYPGAGTTVDDSLGLQLSATSILSEMHQVTPLAVDTPLALHNIIACTAGASNKSFPLPSAATTPTGLYRVIKVDSGAGGCLVQATGGDSLNGAPNGSMTVTGRFEELWVTLLPALPGWTATPRKTQWNLGTDVTGNLSVNNLNGGSGASSSTVWCGNGTWCTPTGGGGGGAVGISGTPVNGQTAEWISGTVLQGVSVTGSGQYVKASSPTLTSPNLGIASAISINGTPIPASTVLPTISGTPVAGQSVEWTSASAMGGVGTTGTGVYVKQASPTLITPNLGAATATSINGTIIPAFTVLGSGVVALGSPNAAARYSTADTTVGPSTGLTLSATKVLTTYNNVITITSNTTLDQHNLVKCIAAGGTVTATLPLVSTATAGHYTIVKDDATGICQVARAGTDTFNGLAGPLQLTKQYDAVVIEAWDTGSPGVWWYTAVKAQWGYVHLNVKGADLPLTNAAIIQVDEPRPKLVFDAATPWCASWTFTMNPDYGLAPQVVYKYTMTSAAAGSTKMDWSVWKTTAAQAEGGQTPGYDASVNTCTDAAVPATFGRVAQVTCALPFNDGMAANDEVTIKACRNTTGTAGGNLNMISAQLQYYKQ
ncbi:MAG TPA: hypothetical protein VF077_12490 [Nitrospiraceae bacterium]